MHNRRGPSIMQDYRDLAKLFARPESQSEDASFALRIMPPLFFAVAFMLAMGLPLFTAQSPIPVFGDAITIMYSLALARFFFALCGVDSSNAYAGIGGVRELLMSVLIEPSMLLALLAAAWCAAPPTSHHGSAHHDGAIDAPVAVILAGIAFAIAATWNSVSCRLIRPRPSRSFRKVRSPTFRPVACHGQARHVHEAGPGRCLVLRDLCPLG